jgi:hypothetical protein
LSRCATEANLFGFQTTRERLRLQVGAVDPGWTSQQILDSLALLEHARASWLAFAQAQTAVRRELKREGQRQPAMDRRMLHLTWLDTYLRGGPARTWLTDDLGACTQCGHLNIHHYDRGCLICQARRPGKRPPPAR